MSSPILSIKDVVVNMGGEKAFLYIAKAREVAKKGIEVISFGVGQPDIPTFQHIIDAAKEALDKKFTGYTETAGIPELREAIADYLNKRYNAGVDPSEVIVTTGAKTAILLAIASYIKPGDEVIIPDPTYPAYGQVTRLFGGVPKYIPLRFEGPEKGFRLDIETIEKSITDKTRMIVLNNPHNPTGTVFTPSEVSKICEIAKDNKLLLLVDEIYDNFVYGEVEFRSVLLDPDWKDYVLYVNGFSKTFSMTGWRLGYLVVKKEVASSIVKLATNVYSCPVSFAQIGGITALKGSWEPVRRMIELFKKRRDKMHELLSKIPGFEVWKSTGAFYMFPRISKILKRTGLNVEQFVDHLLYNYGVVVLPGTAFSEVAGNDFLRFSFATSIEKIERGIERISKAVTKLLEGGA